MAEEGESLSTDDLLLRSFGVDVNRAGVLLDDAAWGADADGGDSSLLALLLDGDAPPSAISPKSSATARSASDAIVILILFVESILCRYYDQAR